MRLLLDSHVALWWMLSPERLSKVAFDAVSDAAIEVFVSSATIWELRIKSAKGKLTMPDDFEKSLLAEAIVPLSITWEHGKAAAELPHLHGDPFDRMLVAQAQIEGLTLVTCDPEVQRYGVAFITA